MHPTSLQTVLGLYLLSPDPRLTVEGALALFAALIAVAVRRRDLVLGSRGLTLIAMAFALDVACEFVRGAARLQIALEAAAVVFFFWGLIYFALRLFEKATIRRRVHASTIFNDLLMIVLYSIVLMSVLRSTLNFDLAPLLATSAVLSVVLGLGLQETLGNIFSGLTLQWQKPFLPGDWVHFGNFMGRVQGVGWRSTRLLTRSNERLEIPNALLSKDVLTNYSALGVVADQIFVGLPYAEPPNRIKDVVLRVLAGIPEVLEQPEPEVYAWEYADSAVKYRIKYWLSDYTIQEKLRDRVSTALWYALRRNSIEIPFPIRTLYMHQVAAHSEVVAEKERALLDELRSVDFLSTLSDDELRLFIPTTRVHQFGHGETLEREGEIGDCFHVLRRGSVELVFKGGNGAMVHMTNLDAPTFFGETSLVTGEPRNATIRALTDVEVLEISRDGFAQLFKLRPEAAALVSDVIEPRLNDNRARRSQTPESQSRRDGERWLLTKMRKIFDLD